MRKPIGNKCKECTLLPGTIYGINYVMQKARGQLQHKVESTVKRKDRKGKTKGKLRRTHVETHEGAYRKRVV